MMNFKHRYEQNKNLLELFSLLTEVVTAVHLPPVPFLTTIYMWTSLPVSLATMRGIYNQSCSKTIASIAFCIKRIICIKFYFFTDASEHLKESLSSIFSPRMDFDQWKPLTGRGDPLRNDPTYDYEPPVLERVHYWADDPRPEPVPYKPERKSEVLVLGVSSRRPSVTSRKPPRHNHRPPPPKYEDFAYKLSDHYPMTILVPPPPPPSLQPPLFLLTDEKLTTPQIKATESITPPTTESNDYLTSLYALQEANLIFQSSTVSQNWIQHDNHTGTFIENAVSSDYAGWGPTTPINEEDINNDTQNFISNEKYEVSKHPYSFYRPMLSESPPPPKHTLNPLLLTTFLPTVLPPRTTTQSTPTTTYNTVEPTDSTTTETPYTYTENYDTVTYDEVTTTPGPVPSTTLNKETTIFDMLRPMISMPMPLGPERPQDHLYAHASENLHVFKEHTQMDDAAEFESMQTMQPPPPSQPTDTTLKLNEPYKTSSKYTNVRKDIYKPNTNTIDPYLQFRVTAPLPTVVSMVEAFENSKTTTESSATPMYLIIQGHSKVKTYSSKSKPVSDTKDITDNEITNIKGSQQVKHLHPIKEKYSAKKIEKSESDRNKYAKSLKMLISDGVGKIDIQEADIGIKYDVSDGTDVPIEIYKKGIVESDENDYSSSKVKLNRTKREFHLEDFLPFNADVLDEVVENYITRRKNTTLSKYDIHENLNKHEKQEKHEKHKSGGVRGKYHDNNKLRKEIRLRSTTARTRRAKPRKQTNIWKSQWVPRDDDEDDDDDDEEDEDE